MSDLVRIGKMMDDYVLLMLCCGTSCPCVCQGKFARCVGQTIRYQHTTLVIVIICLTQMDGVSRQLPGKRIDDYLSMLSTESTSSNNQPDGPGQLNSDMQLEEISLI